MELSLAPGVYMTSTRCKTEDPLENPERVIEIINKEMPIKEWAVDWIRGNTGILIEFKNGVVVWVYCRRGQFITVEARNHQLLNMVMHSCELLLVRQ